MEIENQYHAPQKELIFRTQLLLLQLDRNLAAAQSRNLSTRDMEDKCTGWNEATYRISQSFVVLFEG